VGVRAEVWGWDAPPHRGGSEGFHSSLEWRIWVHSERVLTSRQKKMLNFPLEMVILWTLKMYFWETVNTQSELWGW